MELKERYMSKKDFGEDRTNVGYALYVRENLKPNDYFKTNTGEIYKSMNVSPISNGKIYYANGEHYWVNESAVVNFSPNIIDLIECLDIVELYIVGLEEDNITQIIRPETLNELKELKKHIKNGAKIKSITTREMFESMSYKVGEVWN